MESGFGQNLEGFLIKGNLSLAPSANPSLQGDGSVEGSGTLYFDSIKEYNYLSGVNIQDVSFQNGKLTIPYTIASDNATSASVIIDGGISVKHTQNATSTTSGGALTVVGGVSIGKDLLIGGNLNMTGNAIKNVAYPVIGSDGVNKDYVDDVAGRVSGNFTTGQVIFADSNGDAIRGYDFFKIDSNGLDLSLPLSITNTNNAGGSSSSLQVYGGVNIKKDTIVEGLINLSGNSIINLSSPVNNSDAVNKQYVDNLITNLTFGNISGNFTSGQLIVADTSGNTVRGYDTLTFNGTTLTLFNTSNNSFVCYGGISIDKDVFIGGVLNVNNNKIINVADPVNDLDAVNKEYVDNLITNLTFGNINGNFTSGQLIIADTSGNSIKGYNNLTFTSNSTTGSGSFVLNNVTDISIQNTNNALGLGSGGTLTSSGGASFQKDVYIGGKLDVNLQNITSVADPIDNYDAVNKEYVDNLFENCCNGSGGGGSISTNVFNLNNNVLFPEDIPIFYYPETILAFTATVYLQYNNTNMALFTIRGMHCGDSWVITSTYIGTPLGIKFSIRNNSGQGLLQYTNKNTTGLASIRFSTTSTIDEFGINNQLDIPILNNITTFTDIPLLSFPYITVDSFKLTAFVSSTLDEQCGLFFINSVYSNGEWNFNSHNIGDIKGIDFNISSGGVIQYKNNNSANDYIIRVVRNSFFTSQTSIILNSNTVVSTNINTNDLTFQSITNFQLSIVANEPITGKSALFEIAGILDGTTWKLNSRYIGDDLEVKFYINTISGNVGVLQYTNKNINDVNIRYIKNIQNLFEPLSVILGGTGNSRLNPYTVLRGNGTNPIIGTDDFIYKDYKLTLGEQSSIVLKNTTTATSLTNGGSLISYGGASFQKDVFIGGQLDVNLQNIKNVADPIVDYDAVNKLYVDTAINNVDLNNNDNPIEQNIVLNNNVLVAQDIPNIKFDNTTRAFISNIYVQSGSNSALYTIRGINCNTYWLLSSSLIGNSCGVDFHIRKQDNYGYLQYTNQNVIDVTSIKYTQNSTVYTDQTSSQIHYNLLPQNVFTEIPILSFSNDILDSVKLVIYLSSNTDNKYGLVLANCVLRNNEWNINTYNIGDVSGIRFRIKSNTTNSVIEYINTNASTDYTIRVTNINILNTLDEFTLIPNTNTPTIIDTPLLSMPIDLYYFQLSIYVNVPLINKSALYEVQGVVCNNEWTINSRYTGDYTGIKFYINTLDNIGYLSFTNTNNVNAYIKFIKNVPLTSLKPLKVSKGGTGSTYLNPYTILRGNGTSPIIGTADLIYQNNQLIVGNTSQIIITNSSSSVNLTTGSTFVAYGGVSINKELFIGKQLVVKDVDITPNKDDISAERVFSAQNNIIIPNDINGFVFTSSSTKSFSAIACISIETNSDEFDALYEIKGLKKRSGWMIDYKYIGDDLGINFTIQPSGQIQYTSTNTSEWISTTIKFRGVTTTC